MAAGLTGTARVSASFAFGLDAMLASVWLCLASIWLCLASIASMRVDNALIHFWVSALFLSMVTSSLSSSFCIKVNKSFNVGVSTASVTSVVFLLIGVPRCGDGAREDVAEGGSEIFCLGVVEIWIAGGSDLSFTDSKFCNISLISFISFSCRLICALSSAFSLSNWESCGFQLTWFGRSLLSDLRRGGKELERLLLCLLPDLELDLN